MTLHKKIILLSVLCLGISACVMPTHSGFWNPITLDTRVPDGPPEFKAGWYAGCKTGSSLKSFANNTVFQKDSGPDIGSGVYTHDPVYQSAWGQGWFACAVYTGTFAARSSLEFSPLD